MATFFVTQFDSLSPEEVDMLLRLQARGHEIGCHGARHLLAEPFVKERGWQAYLKADVFPALKAMEAAGLRVRSFAWPYGDGFRWGELKLRRHFAATRAVTPLHPRKGLPGTDKVFFRPGKRKRFHSASFDRNGGADLTTIQEALLRAKKRGEVLLLHSHAPCLPESGQEYCFDIPALEAILESANKLGIRFYTVNQFAG